MSLTEEVPAHWVSALRPFLQRADEFKSRNPVVSYFLCTHAAYLAMKMRKKEDHDGTKYLMKLLNVLEQEKKNLASEIAGVDGRTELTKFALMLFTKADDEERQGKANLNIVRLFFTASILFDATAQFTDDGQLDPIAMEKRTYARYIAVRMKKAIESGVPYKSPNTLESHEGDGDEERGPATEPQVSPQHSTPFVPWAPPVNDPNTVNVNNDTIGNHHNNNNNDNMNFFSVGDHHHGVSQPPYQPPPPANPPPPPFAQPIPNAEVTPMAPWAFPNKGFSQREEPEPMKHTPFQTVRPPPPGPAPPVAPAGKPSVDAMIEAQKFAKQAVSALQFYDYNNARQQLLAAIHALDGK